MNKASMDNQEIVFRPIEEKDNQRIAELIRTVFREFNIAQAGNSLF